MQCLFACGFEALRTWRARCCPCSLSSSSGRHDTRSVNFAVFELVSWLVRLFLYATSSNPNISCSCRNLLNNYCLAGTGRVVCKASSWLATQQYLPAVDQNLGLLRSSWKSATAYSWRSVLAGNWGLCVQVTLPQVGLHGSIDAHYFLFTSCRSPHPYEAPSKASREACLSM